MSTQCYSPTQCQLTISFFPRNILLTKDKKERTRGFLLLLEDHIGNNITSMDFADRNINFPTNKTFAMWALFITGCFSTRPVRTDADIDKKGRVASRMAAC